MPTAKQTTTDAAKTKQTRKAKTAADLKAELEKAKANLAALEQRAYAEELNEVISKTNIISDYNTIKANSKATDLTILAAIGKAVGISRLVITQSEVKKRASKAK